MTGAGITRADTTTSGWEGILNPGERILWQGQPDAGLDLSKFDRRRAIPGFFIAAFAIFWTTVSLGAIEEGPIGLVFPLFGLFFIVLALRQIGGGILVDAWRRRNSWYSLSTERAFIATRRFARKSLDAYPITAATRIIHEDWQPGNIWFATDFQNGKRVRIGFARLPESNTVYRLMQSVQRGEA